MKSLAGYHAALPTPLTPDGSMVADDALGQLVRRNLESGLTGLYVGGSTSEAFLLSEEERLRVLALAAEAAGGAGVLIAHVGDINPQVSLRLAREARRLGYHAVSAVPPFYFGYRFDEIEAHYRALAGATDLPFLIYNFPALSGVRFRPEQLALLLAIENVVGLKNTCADHHALERLRRLAPETMIFNGFDETLLAGLSLGADGGIGSTYNLHAGRVLALAQAHAAGDMDTARDLQGRINALIDVLLVHGVFPSLKYLLELSGIPMGPCRAPFLPLSASAKTELEHAMDIHLSNGDTMGQQRRAGGE